MNKHAFSTFSLALLITAVLLCHLPVLAKEAFSYSQLRQLIKTGKTSGIQKVIVTLDSPQIEVQLAGSDDVHSVLIPPEIRDKLINELDEANVEIEVRDSDKSAFWFSMLSSFFLPILLLVGFLFMFRSARVATSSRS